MWGSRYSKYRRSYTGRSYGGKKYYSPAAKANRIIRSSQNGTKRIQVSLPRTFDGTLTFVANSSVSNVLKVRATSSDGDTSTLPYCPGYEAYSKLYDEARIVAVKAAFTFGNAFTSGTSTYMTFYSAVDRLAFMQSGGSIIDAGMTAAEIGASSSCKKTNFTTQQRLACYRTMYPSSYVEKNTWWDTTIAPPAGGNGAMLSGLMQNLSAYNPVLYFFVAAGVAPTANVSLPFRVELTFVLEFRNPKMSIPTGSSKGGDLISTSKFLFGAGHEDEDKKDGDMKLDVEDDPGTS